MKKLMLAVILTLLFAVTVFAGGNTNNQKQKEAYVYVTADTTYRVDIGSGAVETSPTSANTDSRASQITAVLRETGGKLVRK